MKAALLFVVVAVVLAYADAGCVDRDESGGSWFDKAKCDIAAAADRVGEKAKEAYEKTKEVAIEGYEKAKDLVGDGVDKAKEVSKSTGAYISDAFSDDHKSSEEQDDKKETPASTRR